MTNPEEKDLKDRYHYSKLALFNIRLLGRFQQLADSGHPISVIIKDISDRNRMGVVPSLLHQATFLQFAYICIVWLWESVKQAKMEENLINNIPFEAKKYKLDLPTGNQINGERPLDDWKSVINLIRNALSHGKVLALEGSFVFSDQNKRKNEKEPTKLTISWEDLAKISEMIIFSLTPILYPDWNEKTK